MEAVPNSLTWSVSPKLDGLNLRLRNFALTQRRLEYLHIGGRIYIQAEAGFHRVHTPSRVWHPHLHGQMSKEIARHICMRSMTHSSYMHASALVVLPCWLMNTRERERHRQRGGGRGSEERGRDRQETHYIYCQMHLKAKSSLHKYVIIVMQLAMSLIPLGLFWLRSSLINIWIRVIDI